MLSIAKLRVGAEAYQLTGVAQSLGDYYSGAGEAAGRWAGHGADILGLVGEVQGEALRAVLAGIEPGTGGLSPNGEQIRAHARRVPGFDLTFKAPKSVSVLYAISDDPGVQGAVIDAAEAALADTLGWVEREVMAVRRGSDDRRYLTNLAAIDPAAAEAKRLRVDRGADLIAAVFRHRTSRAGDPLLHWHVLVPNLVRGADGRWSAFVHPDLYRLQKAAGEVFQAALRDQLTRRLGVEWRPGRHVGEVDGIPQSVLDGFSKRSAEIDAWLADHGRGQSPAARQEAVLATRRHKAEVEGERFDTAWKIEGTSLGFGPDHAERLLVGLHLDTPAEEVWRLPERSIGPEGVPYVYDRIVTPEAWIADLLVRDLLTVDAAFTAAQVYEAVARRLGDGATVATIDRVAARVLASNQVLPLAPAGRGDSVARWTSTVMAATERRLLTAFDQRGTRAPIAPALVDRAVSRHRSLGDDQVNAVRTIAMCTDPVAVLIGPAGTGKTYTLAVLRHALELSGLVPVGAAPSARAAAELEAGTGIEARTLHSLARRWARPGHGPHAGTVLVVDEAAMGSTVDLEPLVTRTVAAGGRVVLVGDHHQLPEIGPGGALAAACDHTQSVAELSVNRRQVEAWEQAALAHLRAGSVPDAVDAYRANGRVVVTADHDTMQTAAVDHYLDALTQGRRPVLMAGTNDTVHLLNDTARRRLADHHVLDLAAVVAASGGRELVVGDRVVLRRNATLTQPDGTRVRVRNSDVATILAAQPDGGIVVRRDADHATLVVDGGYVRAGWVDHGYAVTAHRAQGGTWDHAIAVGVDGLYREAAYVQLSRGRHTNTLIVPQAQMAEIDAELARHGTGIPLPGEEPADTIDDLVGRLATSRAKMMALTRDLHADHVAELATEWTVPELEAHAGRARHAEHAATDLIGIDPGVLARAVERAQHTAHHVTVGQQVKAFDHHNIGVVVAVDDDTGTIDAEFTSHTGHTATRTLPWTEIHIVEPHLPPPRVLPAAARHRLDQLSEACGQTLDQWHQHLAEHGTAAGDAARCDRAAQLLVDRHTRHLTANPPGWLTDTLGPRPATAHHASVWDHAVEAVARYRLRYDLPTHTDTLGPPPALDPDRLRHWTATTQQLHASRHTLVHPAIDDRQPARRNPAQLETRKAELEAILATAPDDTRTLIATLTRTDQPTLTDTHTELRAALETQGHRRTWILEHWPHIVEHAEIQGALLASLGPVGRTPEPIDRAIESPSTARPETVVAPPNLEQDAVDLGPELW